MDDKEKDMEGEGRDGENEDEGSEEDGSFAKRFGDRWGWISSVDSVAETIRESWDVVFNKNIVEFLNILSYTKDKAELEKQQAREFQNKLNKTKVY